MNEPLPGERTVMLIAVLAGSIAATGLAVYLGIQEGIDVGFAVFFLSWTFVALFALVVRFVFRRLTPAPPQQPASGMERRPRKKRKR